MNSRDFSTKRGEDVAQPLVPDVPNQWRLRAPQPMRSVEEVARFLADVEAVFGRDDRPHGPTVGDRFLL